MKSSIKIVSAAFVFLLVFNSCKVIAEYKEDSSDDVQGASVSVSIAQEKSRTALPDILWENYVYTLEAKETSKGGKITVFSEKPFSDISATYSIPLGIYSFTLCAFNASSSDDETNIDETSASETNAGKTNGSSPALSVSSLAFSGSEDNVNLSDGKKLLSFKMYPAEGGKGSARIKLFLKDGVESVKAGISSVPFADECDLIPVSVLEKNSDSSASFGEEESSVTFYASGLSSGSVQYAIFYLYDSRNRLVATLSESIIVVAGSESASEISESSYSLSFPLSVKLVRESAKKNESDYKGTVYSNGLSLIICSDKSESGEEQTKIYIDENSDGIIDENSNPLEIAGYNNFTGWDITSEYYLGNQNLITENQDVRITMTGGSVRSLSGLNLNSQSSSVYVNGSSQVGSEPVSNSEGEITKIYGIDLSSFTDECVFINKEMSGNYFLTLITSYEFDSSSVRSVAELSDINYATLGRVECYKLSENKTNYTRENLEMKSTSGAGAEIVLAKDDDIDIPTNYTKGIKKHSQSIDISKNSSGDVGFSLGEGRIKHSCSVFSVSVTNGSFTVGKTKVSDSETGVTYMAQKTETTYETSLEENEKYIYMQVMSSGGQISKESVSDFLANVTFIPGKDGDSFKKMKVKINIETVPYSEIAKGIQDSHTYKDGTSETITQEIMYFDGSFYIRANNKYSKATASEPNSGGLDRIDECYKKAKQFTFNGLQGYLMTPDSLIESNYIYKAYADKQDNGVATNGRGWMGAAAIVPTNGWDKDTFEFSEEDGKNGADYFYWICGPNAGKPFWGGRGPLNSEEDLKKYQVYKDSYGNWIFHGDSYAGTNKYRDAEGKEYTYENESELEEVFVYWNNKYNKFIPETDKKDITNANAPHARVTDGGESYNVLQFQGTAHGRWNDLRLNDKSKDGDLNNPNAGKPHDDSYWADYYYVEFTPYSNEFTTQIPAYAPISKSATIDLNDAKDYINTL